MDNLNFTTKDILQKEFKEKRMGSAYDPVDVDSFLDDIIRDYDTFNKEISRLNDENKRLVDKNDELTRQLEEQPTAVAQPAPSVAPGEEQTAANTTENSNVDILKRLSNLENRVFGPQVESGKTDSHRL